MTRLPGSFLAAVIAVGSVAAQGAAHARTGAPVRLFTQAPAPPTTPAGARFDGPPRPADPPGESVTNKWWFWAGVGGVVALTGIVLLVAADAPSAPKTTLGNMEAFKERR